MSVSCCLDKPAAQQSAIRTHCDSSFVMRPVYSWIRERPHSAWLFTSLTACWKPSCDSCMSGAMLRNVPGSSSFESVSLTWLRQNHQGSCHWMTLDPKWFIWYEPGMSFSVVWYLSSATLKYLTACQIGPAQLVLVTNTTSEWKTSVM